MPLIPYPQFRAPQSPWERWHFNPGKHSTSATRNYVFRHTWGARIILRLHAENLPGLALYSPCCEAPLTHLNPHRYLGCHECDAVVPGNILGTAFTHVFEDDANNLLTEWLTPVAPSVIDAAWEASAILSFCVDVQGAWQRDPAPNFGNHETIT